LEKRIDAVLLEYRADYQPLASAPRRREIGRRLRDTVLGMLKEART
jgi:hypothetical protein